MYYLHIIYLLSVEAFLGGQEGVTFLFLCFLNLFVVGLFFLKEVY